VLLSANLRVFAKKITSPFCFHASSAAAVAVSKDMVYVLPHRALGPYVMNTILINLKVYKNIAEAVRGSACALSVAAFSLKTGLALTDSVIIL
jgi:hypothetical protein